MPKPRYGMYVNFGSEDINRWEIVKKEGYKFVDVVRIGLLTVEKAIQSAKIQKEIAEGKTS